jgi:hypothetical protein
MSTEQFRPRPLTASERGLVLDAARGLTAAQSGKKRGLTIYQVYEVQKKLRRLMGAETLPHLVALAMAYGDIGHFEIIDRKD